MVDAAERDRIIDGFEEAMSNLHKVPPGSEEHQRILANLQMKLGLMQYVATTHQMRASDAAVKNAKYMLWSVICAAVAALSSLVSTVVSNWPR
jgi:hypothetical protein